MDLKQLRVFRTVVKNKSFSKAAEELGITQPAISFQIRSLEESLGTKLLDRSGSTIKLTESGKILNRHIDQFIAIERSLKQELFELEDVVKGKLKIGASEVPGMHYLPHLLLNYKNKYPEIFLSLQISDSQKAIQDVLDGQIELAFVGRKMPNPKLTFKQFAEDELVLIASPYLDLPKKGKLNLKDLTQFPLILRNRGSGTRQVFEDLIKDHDMTLKDFKVVMELDSNEAVKQFVIAGLGIALISHISVELEEEAKLCTVLETEFTPLYRDLYLVYITSTILPPATKGFLQFVEEELLKKNED